MEVPRARAVGDDATAALQRCILALKKKVSIQARTQNINSLTESLYVLRRMACSNPTRHDLKAQGLVSVPRALSDCCSGGCPVARRIDSEEQGTRCASMRCTLDANAKGSLKDRRSLIHRDTERKPSSQKRARRSSVSRQAEDHGRGKERGFSRCPVQH